MRWIKSKLMGELRDISLAAMDREKRLQNLVMARRKYSLHSKELASNGRKDCQDLKHLVENHKKEMNEIQEELARCRIEYNRIIKNIGKAHRCAEIHENQENSSEEMIRKREERTRSRAEMVLLDEIKNLKTKELKKQLEKERMLKKRRELFRMKSPSTKVKSVKIYRDRLEEWNKLEEMVVKELDRLIKEKTETKISQRREVNNIRPAKKQVFVRRIIKPVERKLPKKDVQIQTEENNKGSVPTLDSIENIINRKIKEKLKEMEKVPFEAPKIQVKHNIATNTSVRNVDLPSSQTSYLSLPNLSASDIALQQNQVTINGNEFSESEMSEINFKDLIGQVKSIRQLINNQRNNLPRETSSLPESDKELIENRMNRTFSKKVSDINKTNHNISPVTSSSSNSTVRNALDHQKSYTLSFAEEELAASRNDVPELDSEASISSFSQSQSFQNSIEITNLSKMLSVDKELFWQQVLDLAGLKTQKYQRVSPVRPRRATSLKDFRFQSTPIVSNRLART